MVMGLTGAFDNGKDQFWALSVGLLKREGSQGSLSIILSSSVPACSST